MKRSTCVVMALSWVLSSCAAAVIPGAVAQFDSLRKIVEAEAEAEKGPNDQRLADLGFSSIADGHLSVAETYLDSALAINPHNPYALLNLGVVYQSTGRAAEARMLYTKLIAINPPAKALTATRDSQVGMSLVEIAQANLAQIEAAGLPVVEPPPAAAEIDRAVLHRFYTIAKLLDEGLITKDEYSARRQANLGALLPLTAPLPTPTLSRRAPHVQQVIGRLHAIAQFKEVGALSDDEYRIERASILDALMPLHTGEPTDAAAIRKLAAQHTPQIARLDQMLAAKLISKREYERERGALVARVEAMPKTTKVAVVVEPARAAPVTVARADPNSKVAPPAGKRMAKQPTRPDKAVVPAPPATPMPLVEAKPVERPEPDLKLAMEAMPAPRAEPDLKLAMEAMPAPRAEAAPTTSIESTPAPVIEAMAPPKPEPAEQQVAAIPAPEPEPKPAPEPAPAAASREPVTPETVEPKAIDLARIDVEPAPMAAAEPAPVERKIADPAPIAEPTPAPPPEPKPVIAMVPEALETPETPETPIAPVEPRVADPAPVAESRPAPVPEPETVIAMVPEAPMAPAIPPPTPVEPQVTDITRMAEPAPVPAPSSVPVEEQIAEILAMIEPMPVTVPAPSTPAPSTTAPAAAEMQTVEETVVAEPAPVAATARPAPKPKPVLASPRRRAVARTQLLPDPSKARPVAPPVAGPQIALADPELRGLGIRVEPPPPPLSTPLETLSDVGPVRNPPTAGPGRTAQPETRIALLTPPAEATPSPSQSVIDSGGYVGLHLSSFRTPERAKRNWEDLSSAHGDVLGGLGARIARVDLGDEKGVFYQLHAGPVVDEATARSLCTELKRRSLYCAPTLF